jgi:hypothetical protein
MSPAEMTAWLESDAAPKQAEGHPNPQIRRLLELGADTKAVRLNDCGNTFLRRCPVGHQYHGGRLYCSLAMCIACAPRRALEIHHRWQATEDAYAGAHPHAQLTFLDISIRVPRDRDLAISIFERTRQITGTAPVWSYLVGFIGGWLRFRVLAVTQQRNDWHLIWPGATIKSSVFPIYELRYVFSECLLKVELPKSPIDRAEQEVLFTAVHRFRARNIKRLAPHQENISVGGLDPNASTERFGPLDRRQCPKCGRMSHERSQWFPPGYVPRSPDEIRWRADRR